MSSMGAGYQVWALKPGCQVHAITCKVPNAEVGVFDQLLAKHEAFMRETHQPGGDSEPHAMVFTWCKSAGEESTLYGLHECYRGAKGCTEHLVVASAKAPQLLEEFGAIVGKHANSWVTFAPVIHTMKDSMVEGMAAVDSDKKMFQLHFNVDEGSDAEKEMDAFAADHAAFMEETHTPNGSGAEPSPLYFVWTKSAQFKDPFDPSKGSEPKVQFSLTEIYKGQEGCDAHMAAGQANAPLFARFQAVVEKHSVATCMMADVIRSMR